jgi:hexosaminidase
MNTFNKQKKERSMKSTARIFLALAVISTCAVAQDTLPIIPKPEQVERGEGSFTLTARTPVVVKSGSEALADIARLFTADARVLVGLNLAVRKVQDPAAAKKAVILVVDSSGSPSRPEGYTLAVGRSGIVISAATPAGVFYGTQSLLQMMPAKRSDRVVIPSVTVRDAPRFPWRGMHLDVSRHFFPKKFIKTYIDMIAMHKMNVFHWHLTDDQGWRIEIKKYPKLTKVGAWRVNRENHLWDNRKPARPGEKATYGGFYTQKDIREIVEYAARRYVTIVPEIEMPAHSVAALASYPQYSCTGGPFLVPVGGYWPNSDIYCAGNDSTFAFLQDILSEVIDLFPGTFIHIGGDEADKAEWKKCPKCQARIRENNLKDESELQSYFVKRIEKFIISKGRRLIGWDEILEGGLAPEATVMSWRGISGGIAAARENHDVVMSPTSHCYFDYYQGPRYLEPWAIGGFTPVSKVYTYEPVPDSLTEEQGRHILGAQANVWTEYIQTPKYAEYMSIPRMAAMAEVVWSPKGARQWADFSSRLSHLMAQYAAHGYGPAKSAYAVTFATALDTVSRKITVSLSSELDSSHIYYTLDGSMPSGTSHRYGQPFTVGGTPIAVPAGRKGRGVRSTGAVVTLRAAVLRRGKPLGPVSVQRFEVHRAAFRPITLAFPYEQYTGGGGSALVNMIRGTTAYNDGAWQGYHHNDLDAVVDLGEVVPIGRISSSYLEDVGEWIFWPTAVEYSVSADGAAYTTVGTFTCAVPKAARAARIKEFSKRLEGVKARFVRVVAKNLGVCPEWHGGKGENAWLFADEIVVE